MPKWASLTLRKFFKKRGFILLNMKNTALVLPILLILASSIVFAANIEGIVYDIELNTVKDVIVEIDTIPKQSFVSKDGNYSFDVPNGEYIISARHEQGLAKEKIVVADDRKYNIDLILFPDFSEEEELLSESDLDIGTSYTEEKDYSLYYLLGFVIAIVIVIAVVFHYKRKLETSLKKELKEMKDTQKEEKEDVEADLKELLDFIKKESGRTTQKDIRKHFPQSEAKISLMIAELEHKGKIKKIKKGRGNIITLR